MSLQVQCEAKLESEPCVLAWDCNNLFVGTEDGLIKCYDGKLSPGASWSAHSSQVFALDAAAGKVYSASNDGSVRVWTEQGERISDIPHAGGDIEAIHVYGTNIFTGDEAGNVTVYENNAVKAQYNVLEEVKALQFRPPFLFTARDLYVTVTEIKPEESKTRFVTRHSMEGRAPLRIAGDHLLVTARGGNHLRLHQSTVDNDFKLIHEVKVSDMIITSVAVSGYYAWTGGWDGHVKRWKISDSQLDEAGDLDVGACINAIVAENDNAYVALSGGKLSSTRQSNINKSSVKFFQG